MSIKEEKNPEGLTLAFLDNYPVYKTQYICYFCESTATLSHAQLITFSMTPRILNAVFA